MLRIRPRRDRARSAGSSDRIVAQEILTPEDLEQRWGLPGGHIFHGESTLDQSWAARPLLGWADYRTPIEGLYLASAGTHPGGGLTGLPGLLASGVVQQDFKRRICRERRPKGPAYGGPPALRWTVVTRRQIPWPPFRTGVTWTVVIRDPCGL